MGRENSIYDVFSRVKILIRNENWTGKNCDFLHGMRENLTFRSSFLLHACAKNLFDYFKQPKNRSLKTIR